MITKPVAFYKIRPTHTLPCRPGPVQCVRNCANCILKQDGKLDVDEENIIAIKSYDNLVARKSIWFSSYQTILYHPGQIDVLRNSLEWIAGSHSIYIVGCTRLEDIQYFQMVLQHEKMSTNMKIIERSSADSTCLYLSKNKSIIVPINLRSCPIGDQQSAHRLLASEHLLYIMESVINEQMKKKSDGVGVVPIVISKDHDWSSRVRSLVGYGSLCVQILEPYSLRDYIDHLHFKKPADHFIQHIYHDLARHAPRLPSHFVAYILLYLNRDDQSVSREDLIDYMNWIRNTSLEYDLQITFSGLSEHAVDHAIEILKEYIHVNSKLGIYRPSNLGALTEYANTLAPNFACYGIICRAILTIYNSDPKNAFRICFDPDTQFRVLKDDVIELSVKMAEKLDKLVPCRRPCTTITINIIDTLTKMQTFGHYFRIEEPKFRRNTGKLWAGDYDSDDEYYWSKKDDPAFKSWLLLTQRPYRLDRLNLFMNSIDIYLQ